jgi:hypothetical protein
MEEFEGLQSTEGPWEALAHEEVGAVTAEYAIAILAAAGFAGMLLAILQSDTVRGWLMGIIEQALSL